ncbi:cupin domain-containing protein [Pseudomonas sp. 5Ae-yellow]|uniref:cupin domain-containing protein n=1 Tax=Pseudomonas sp. 5Ae-yellow TaxID=2759848 RepID=UPI0015F4B7B0|nr:cupin domain-containing protein [Pseudomonas sp. 5Ae-yellow]MBA6420977.1 cupin domain-containing protein [Pseudomonas sp. 5Ae-yellow]
MYIKRIVTGHDSAGRSCVVSSGRLPGTESFVHSPGFSAAVVWQTTSSPRVGDEAEAPEVPLTSVLPGPGGTSAILVTFPPSDQSVEGFDPQAATAELCERLPGLGELFEADEPGFHRTDSIDYGVVLDGEIILELDDGCTSVLQSGDIVIQMGTRHAWRNAGSTPAKLLFVMVAAGRMP